MDTSSLILSGLSVPFQRQSDGTARAVVVLADSYKAITIEARSFENRHSFTGELFSFLSPDDVAAKLEPATHSTLNPQPMRERLERTHIESRHPESQWQQPCACVVNHTRDDRIGDPQWAYGHYGDLPGELMVAVVRLHASEKGYEPANMGQSAALRQLVQHAIRPFIQGGDWGWLEAYHHRLQPQVRANPFAEAPLAILHASRPAAALPLAPATPSFARAA